MKDAQLFVAQKAFITRGDKVLVLHDPVERLDFPGGKIQEGERDLVESLKREVREESGLEIIVGKPFTTWTEVFQTGHKYAGKTVMLVAYDCEYLLGEVTISEEHDNFKWVNKENYKEVDDGTSYFKVLEEYILKI